MLWITSPTTGQVFKNPLDSTLATPIDFDTSVYLQELLPNQQLDIKGVRVEVFGVPTIVPAANTVISSNIGSQADPIHIHLDMAANQLVLGSSSAKIFVYYDTTTRRNPRAGDRRHVARAGYRDVGCASEVKLKSERLH